MPTPESTSQASFSLAGFQVTIIGRFWVTAEGSEDSAVSRETETVPTLFSPDHSSQSLLQSARESARTRSVDLTELFLSFVEFQL